MEKIKKEKIIKNLDTVCIGRKILYFEEINSTNDYILEQIEKGIDPDGMLVIAEIQDNGKGTFGRKWISPQGGIWFSVAIVSENPLKKLQNITLVCALSVAEAIGTGYLIPVRIKWPNDIYFQAKKIAGILVESKKVQNGSCLIIGIGINANCLIEELVPGNIEASSISSIIGKNIDREMLLCSVLKLLEKYYYKFTEGSSFKDIFEELKTYLIY